MVVRSTVEHVRANANRDMKDCLAKVSLYLHSFRGNFPPSTLKSTTDHAAFAVQQDDTFMVLVNYAWIKISIESTCEWWKIQIEWPNLLIIRGTPVLWRITNHFRVIITSELNMFEYKTLVTKINLPITVKLQISRFDFINYVHFWRGVQGHNRLLQQLQAGVRLECPNVDVDGTIVPQILRQMW